MTSRRSGEAMISREQRRINDLGEGNVDRIVCREIAPQVPYARQKEDMRVAAQRKLREIGQGRAAAFLVNLSGQHTATQNLRHFEIEEVWDVERLPRRE